jgi:hypothetical protein
VNRARTLAAATVAGLLLAGIAFSRHHSDQPAPSAHPQPTTSTAPSSPQPTTPRPTDPAPETAPEAAARAEGLLPFTDQQIAAAADLAARFTAAYATHRYDEPPQTYLNRLAPLTSTQLQPILARSATDGTVLNQRRRDREITTAHAHPEAIRTLGPTSITLLLTTTTHTTTQPPGQTGPRQTPQALQQEKARYAVTVTRKGDGWQVYAIELAITGDAGEAATTGGLP